MDQQINFIVDILNRTTSAVGGDIRRAEDELVDFSKTRGLFHLSGYTIVCILGYGELLLQILSNQTAEARTRLAASVALKNFVRNNWVCFSIQILDFSPMFRTRKVSLLLRRLSQMSVNDCVKVF
jgi:hypothetical protein